MSSCCCDFAQEAVQKSLQMYVVGASPVDLLAREASSKIVKVTFCFWLQAIDDLFFFDRLKNAVTAQAAFPWIDLIG